MTQRKQVELASHVVNGVCLILFLAATIANFL